VDLEHFRSLLLARREALLTAADNDAAATVEAAAARGPLPPPFAGMRFRRYHPGQNTRGTAQ
jgi:hypothetical protein